MGIRVSLTAGLGLAVAVVAAAAAEPTVITLSCDGTITDKTTTPLQPKPIERMDVVVDLDEQTVSFHAYIAPINDVDAASISFGGEQIDLVAQLALEAKVITTDIRGVLDRVTGHLLATTTLYPTKQPYDPNTIVVSDEYDVDCKAWPIKANHWHQTARPTRPAGDSLPAGSGACFEVAP